MVLLGGYVVPPGYPVGEEAFDPAEVCADGRLPPVIAFASVGRDLFSDMHPGFPHVTFLSVGDALP